MPDFTGNRPKWVDNLAMNVTRQILPGSRGMPCTTAADAGLNLGLWWGYARNLWMSEFSIDPKLEERLKKSPDYQRLEEWGEKFGEVLGSNVLPKIRRLAKRALCMATDQETAEAVAFLRGFAKGFDSTPKDASASNIGNSAFDLQLIMLLNWPAVEQLGSVRELHERLQKAFPRRIGDLTRIEKICQRIGKSFGKPGRPKKRT